MRARISASSSPAPRMLQVPHRREEGLHPPAGPGYLQSLPAAQNIPRMDYRGLSEPRGHSQGCGKRSGMLGRDVGRRMLPALSQAPFWSRDGSGARLTAPRRARDLGTHQPPFPEGGNVSNPLGGSREGTWPGASATGKSHLLSPRGTAGLPALPTAFPQHGPRAVPRPHSTPGTTFPVP